MKDNISVVKTGINFSIPDYHNPAYLSFVDIGVMDVL